MKLSSLACVLVLAAHGCGSSSPPPPAGPEGASEVAPATDPTDQVGANSDESTSDLVEHHRHHHHGGIPMFVAMSLDTIGVDDNQRDQIEKIQTDIHAELKPAHDAEKAVLMTIADGVAAGNVDQGHTDAAIMELGKVSASTHDVVADSLNALHQALTPPQRQALVDKVEASIAVWHEANSPDESADKDKHGGNLAKLATDLALTPDQVEKIRGNFTTSMGTAAKYDRAEVDAQFKGFAAAFASDTFDAHMAMKGGGMVSSHMAVWGLTRMSHLYAAAAPVLTPDQRAKAADQLRHHANYKRTDTNE
jgi:Spy/CpxP family protein refolding chaperone